MAQTNIGTGVPSFISDLDVKRLLGDMKLPAMPDMETVLTAYKRNLEALTEANRVALEGAQTVARRHMEIVQSIMSGLSSQMRDLSDVSQTPASRAAKQTELLRKAYEDAVSNTQELGDLIKKSNTEAISKLNARFSEAMTEIQSLLEKKG